MTTTDKDIVLFCLNFTLERMCADLGKLKRPPSENTCEFMKRVMRITYELNKEEIEAKRKAQLHKSQASPEEEF